MRPRQAAHQVFARFGARDSRLEDRPAHAAVEARFSVDTHAVRWRPVGRLSMPFLPDLNGVKAGLGQARRRKTSGAGQRSHPVPEAPQCRQLRFCLAQPVAIQ